MTDVTVEFVGGPLDGTTRSVPTTPGGRPPGRFTVEAGAGGGGVCGRHDYRIGTDPVAGRRWCYEYRGIRPG
jgi:hypothetical protein